MYGAIGKIKISLRQHGTVLFRQHNNCIKHPYESHPNKSHPNESHPNESHPNKSHYLFLIGAQSD